MGHIHEGIAAVLLVAYVQHDVVTILHVADGVHRSGVLLVVSSHPSISLGVAGGYVKWSREISSRRDWRSMGFNPCEAGLYRLCPIHTCNL
jgi:hypothetical protein